MSTPPSIAVPRAVREVVTRLEEAGHEAWCVGGAVRDALLGQADLDWDIATSAEPGEIKRLFSRTVDVGIEHGTVGVFGSDRRLYEVTTFRADVETDGRHAVVRFGVSLDEDLARRDFTINAMAWSPSRRELRDPFGGRADLAQRVLRAVGEPHQRMAEDRLRALRAIRFASRFGFEIEPQTWEAIVTSAPHLSRLSMERVLQEWTKTLEQAPRPSAAFLRWKSAGALAVLVPALADVSDEFFEAIDQIALPAADAPDEVRTLIRLQRLAMPFLPLGGASAKRALQGLRASNQDMAFVSAVSSAWVEQGPKLEWLAQYGADNATDARRCVSAIGRTRVDATVAVFEAVWAARRMNRRDAPTVDEASALRTLLHTIAYRDAIALADLAVSGDDLRAAGIPPGRQLGQILQMLLDAVLADQSLNEPVTLLAMARRLAEVR